jgi:hypothetical protein
LKFLSFANQFLDFFPLLLPLHTLCSSASRSAAGAGPPHWPLPCPRRRSAPACPLPTRHPTPGRRRSPSPLSSSVRATAAPNARRPPPHRRRGEPPGNPWNSYLSRALAPPESLHPISPISLAFPKHPTHTPQSPLPPNSGRARHRRGQPPPSTLRPHRPP